MELHRSEELVSDKNLSRLLQNMGKYENLLTELFSLSCGKEKNLPGFHGPLSRSGRHYIR